MRAAPTRLPRAPLPVPPAQISAHRLRVFLQAPRLHSAPRSRITARLCARTAHIVLLRVSARAPRAYGFPRGPTTRVSARDSCTRLCARSTTYSFRTLHFVRASFRSCFHARKTDTAPSSAPLLHFTPNGAVTECGGTLTNLTTSPDQHPDCRAL